MGERDSGRHGRERDRVVAPPVPTDDAVWLKGDAEDGRPCPRGAPAGAAFGTNVSGR
jgi:hypothetical protein